MELVEVIAKTKYPQTLKRSEAVTAKHVNRADVYARGVTRRAGIHAKALARERPFEPPLIMYFTF